MKIGEFPRIFGSPALAQPLPVDAPMIQGDTQPAESDLRELTPISLDGRLRELEASLIAWALEAANGNKSHAARLLQIKRSTLGDRIARCKIDGLRPLADEATQT